MLKVTSKDKEYNFVSKISLMMKVTLDWTGLYWRRMHHHYVHTYSSALFACAQDMHLKIMFTHVYICLFICAFTFINTCT